MNFARLLRTPFYRIPPCDSFHVVWWEAQKQKETILYNRKIKLLDEKCRHWEDKNYPSMPNI